ncbi:MAG: RNA pseudouridine synthase [Treponema sp.]|jgi:23S rRNA pseudouridine1911/1915/1917 synthase|nr:RNA pseudouridine synthase [Treponema sp.]
MESIMNEGTGDRGERDLRGRIVECCDDYLVLNKLPGESAEAPEVPGGSFTGLPGLLRQELGSGDFFPVHRLDVPVSGCVLFARNPRALAFLSECFRSPGRVEKIYWAVTELPRASGHEPAALPEALVLPGGFLAGGPPPEGPSPELPDGGAYTELVHWLEAGRGNRSAAFDEDGPGRKKGILHCRVLGRGDRYLFLEIKLITGRHHQIRAQLSHIGLPVKGDLKYGARRSERGGGIRLHAHSLAFPGPGREGGTVRVETLPPLIDNLWQAFLAVSPAPAPPEHAVL